MPLLLRMTQWLNGLAELGCDDAENAHCKEEVSLYILSPLPFHLFPVKQQYNVANTTYLNVIKSI